jgi:hypothetical protein
MITKKELMATYTMTPDFYSNENSMPFIQCMNLNCDFCPFRIGEGSVSKCRENVIKYIEMREKINKWKELV